MTRSMPDHRLTSTEAMAAITDEDPPVVDDTMRAGWQDVRDAAELDEQDRVHAVRVIASAAGARAARITSRRAGGVAVALALLIAIGISLVAYTTSVDTRSTLDTAMSQLASSNAQLQAQGRPPVATPSEPTTVDAITAAATARVLAGLPKDPTADQVAALIDNSAATQLVGPSRDVLASQVKAYVAANAALFASPTITPDEIDQAVARRLAANPPRDGTNGANGLNGSSPPCLSAPSQCVGPTGPAGADGAAGAAGANGANGTNGANGRDGADSTVPGPQGPPPASFTMPGVLDRVTCVRDSGSPDAAPTYTCN